MFGNKQALAFKIQLMTWRGQKILTESTNTVATGVMLHLKQNLHKSKHLYMFKII